MDKSIETIHVVVFTHAIWVQLHSSSLRIVVPESVPCIAATKREDEILLHERRDWQRGDRQQEAVILAEEP